jgi:hypothetical protein
MCPPNDNLTVRGRPDSLGRTVLSLGSRLLGPFGSRKASKMTFSDCKGRERSGRGVELREFFGRERQASRRHVFF